MLSMSWAGFHHGIEILLERGRRGVNLKSEPKKKEQKARVQYFQDRSAFGLTEKVLSIDLTTAFAYGDNLGQRRVPIFSRNG